MAIYHLTAKIVTRARGQSAVASAAYRSAEALRDERIGQTFDYSRKQGVEHSEILFPPNAPAWVKDRERLWNEVERAERRKDAQVAREIERWPYRSSSVACSRSSSHATSPLELL